MRQHFIKRNGHKELLLFFAGWGMDQHPFLTIHPTHCDTMICYDYRTLEFDTTPLNPYSSITLVAWSLGVWAASQTLKLHPTLPIIHRTAINGTLYPISDARGISPAIFEGTLQSLNESTLQKFQRRMCGSTNEYKAFQSIAPHRPVNELKAELEAIQAQALHLPPAPGNWQKAIIATGDLIFPHANQRNAWEASADEIIVINTAHYDPALFKNAFQPHTNL